MNKKEKNRRLNEKEINKYNDNNNQDPYGYDFVPTIAHATNIDEQREKTKELENVTNDRKTTNNDKDGGKIDIKTTL